MYISPLDAELLPRIPLTAGTVLDVGCGAAALLRSYRALNPRARLLGMERDPAAAAVAAAHLNEVAVADGTSATLPFDLPDGVDCIIYKQARDDAAEHWSMIASHARFLSPNGVMLLCLPNPDNWQVADRALRGKEAPALFGAASTRRALARAGLELCDVHSWAGLNREGAAYFIEAVTPTLHALGIDPASYAQRAAPSHLIVRAVRGKRQPMIVSGSMLAPVGAVSHVRVVYPLRALATEPYVQTEITDIVGREMPTDGIPRIFILHRPALMGAHGLELVRKLTSAGYLVVTEFDDHPDHFEMMRMGGELTFRGVHAVQTSTSVMAGILRNYNPEVAVFPNALVSLPEATNFVDPSARMTVFFGALNRETDWRPLMPVINNVIRQVGDRIGFQVVHDQVFFEELETPHKAFTPICDHETYLRILSGCEICFMPLNDTAFNRAKSDLKFIEAAACRVASVASPIVYGEVIRDGENGLLFQDGDQLFSGLLRLLALPEEALRLANAARHYVATERMLADQVAPRLAWYRSLWERRAELDDLLNQRLSRAA